MSITPQMAGQVQVILPTPTDAELYAAAEVKRAHYLSMNTIKTTDNVGSVIAAADAMADNDVIRLSQNQKIRMAHRGFDEIEQTWETEATYQEVTVGSSTVWKYVAPDPRPSLAIADTDDGIEITDEGTFVKTTGYVDSENIIPFESITYEGNASSSSANDGLVGPEYTALAADLAQAIIDDQPGKTGGEAMDEANYLSMPGYPIATATTHIAALAVINAYAVASDATAMTIAELEAAGIPINNLLTTKLAAYKVAVALQTSIASISALQQVIVDVNHA